MTTRQQSIDFILDHFEHPRHHGPMADADLVISGGNAGCGDVITLYLKLDAEARVIGVSFEGEGCTISQAAASLTTEHVLGRTLSEINAMPPDPLVDELGREVVSTRMKCATLALNTLKSARKQYENGHAKAGVQLT
jgi:nitrogen fixation NifU-like protein